MTLEDQVKLLIGELNMQIVILDNKLSKALKEIKRLNENKDSPADSSKDQNHDRIGEQKD